VTRVAKRRQGGRYNALGNRRAKVKRGNLAECIERPTKFVFSMSFINSIEEGSERWLSYRKTGIYGEVQSGRRARVPLITLEVHAQWT
jgi:hypothetical protein